MSAINVKVTIPRELPVKQLDQFIDKTVYSTARITLDYTAPHIPRLSGDMERSIASFGVQGGNKTYALGANISYANVVWNYPQNTNWTNPQSYAKWFMTEFKNSKERIVSRAVSEAKRVL